MSTCTSTFDKATTKLFWTDSVYMHCNTRTVAGFKKEGINNPEDLFDLDEDDLDNLFQSMGKLVGTIVKSVYTERNPMHVSTTSKNCIIVVANATRYYTQVGRDITPSNMSWRTLAKFDMQWKALKKQAKQDDSEAPKLGKQGSILNWIKSKKLHLKSIIGVCNFYLAYLLDDTSSRATTRPALLADHQHYEELGSIVEELNLYTSHGHTGLHCLMQT